MADTCIHGRVAKEPCEACRVEKVSPLRDRITLSAEWRTLIHNVHHVGSEFGWHWRCGVAEFSDEACRYDQRTDSYQAMVHESIDHLRFHHGVTVVEPRSTEDGAALPIHRDLDVKAAPVEGEPLIDALRLIAGDRCSSFVGGARCTNPGSGRTRGAKYGADAWCDACIARDALVRAGAEDTRG